MIVNRLLGIRRLHFIDGLIAASLLAAALIAWLLIHGALFFVGVILLAVYAAARCVFVLVPALRIDDPVDEAADADQQEDEDDDDETDAPSQSRRATKSAGNTGELVDDMLEKGRYALLLRPEVAQGLRGKQVTAALDRLDAEMALTPAGPVAVPHILPPGDYDRNVGGGPRVVVPSYYMDRYAVTNRQFKDFVDAGGYEQMALWDVDIWPAVLQFVDTTGQPGPAFWSGGGPPRRRERHPVVGISWFEAAAYARWVGKRLPTHAEWVRAGAWPAGKTQLRQRRFPWGESFHVDLANVWGSHRGGAVPVDEYDDGASVGGVNQLAGNVWEWVDEDYVLRDPRGRVAPMEQQMKCLKGGAFNTYLESQASCEFTSGDHPFARRRNIGFRCIISVADIVEQSAPTTAQAAGSVNFEPSLEVGA